jgi:hypothetical protein
MLYLSTNKQHLARLPRLVKVRDAETTNIPLNDAPQGALRRCSLVVWPATLRSERLAACRTVAIGSKIWGAQADF